MVTAQTARKHFDGRCFFCAEDDYCVLDAHRIFPGEQGGKYDWQNMLTLCANCHRRVHAGKIRIDRRYLSSTGRWLLHYWYKGEEHWRESHPRDAAG